MAVTKRYYDRYEVAFPEGPDFPPIEVNAYGPRDWPKEASTTPESRVTYIGGGREAGLAMVMAYLSGRADSITLFADHQGAGPFKIARVSVGKPIERPPA